MSAMEAESQYAIAAASVRDAIVALEKSPAAYRLDAERGVSWYSGPAEANSLRDRLSQLDARWQFARNDAEREAVARNIGALAARAIELVPPRGCRRDAGIIDIQTPGSIKAEMDTVNGIVHQLDSDIKASTVEDSFKRAWRAFVDEWEKFYKDHAGWFDRLWYSSYEKTVEFRRRVLTWREKFVELGGAPSGPADQPPKSFGEELWKYGKWLLLASAAFVGWKLYAGRPAAPAPAIRNARRSKPLRLHLSDTQLLAWFERDRAHVELRDRRTGQTILEWWDDDVRQAVEDGFLPLHWTDAAAHVAAFEYAKHVGLIEEPRNAGQEPRYSLRLSRGELKALRFLAARYSSARLLLDGLIPLDASAEGALADEFDRNEGPYRFQIRATDVRKALRATRGDGGNYGAIPNLRSDTVDWVLAEERSRAR